MNYRGCLLYLIILLILINGSESLAESSPLRLIVDFDHPVYIRGETFGMTISLKNIGNRKLSLFHPPILGESWLDWALTLRVTKPGRREIVIEPRIVTARMPRPKKDHFRTLAPGESIDIRLSFPGKDPDRTKTRNEWEAILPITRSDLRLPEKLLRWKYRLKGDFCYISTGNGEEFLALDDIAGNVFNVPGRYILEFRYFNRYDYFLAPDGQGKYLVPKKLPDAWKGELKRIISLKVAR